MEDKEFKNRFSLYRMSKTTYRWWARNRA